MSRLNTPTLERVFTHEGAPAWTHTNPEQRLCRSVLSCLLWEKEFYEDGQGIAARIADAANAVPVETLAALAIEARSKFNLRHVPLLLLTILARRARGRIVADTIEATIQRADELSEFLAVYANVNGVDPRSIKKSLSAQVKKGLARAFTKFDAYRLAKYNRPAAIRLRDVLFLCHAKPKDDEQAAVWKKLIAGELESPDTWEVALSAGADKKATFERLIAEGNLGYLALLRNLRNMAQAGCDPEIVKGAILARRGGAQRVLPFRYVAAARMAPQFEPAIDKALGEAIADLEPMSGTTAVLVDVSGSMDSPLSDRSDLTRADAAATLASIIPGDLRVFSFSESIVEVPARRGMAGIDAVLRSQPHSSTYLGQAVAFLNTNVKHDRLIVITDEQSHDRVPDPICKNAYMINVASSQNGIGYGTWTHIDGFSERVLRFIHEAERSYGR